MSGGSHDYAYSKVSMIASDFGDLCDSEIEVDSGYIDVRDRKESVERQVLRKHPLRVALARFLDGPLYQVLRAIEMSDSGDRAPDGWIDETVAFLDKHGIEYGEDWENIHAALIAKQHLDSDEAFAERHDAILAEKGLDRFRRR